MACLQSLRHTSRRLPIVSRAEIDSCLVGGSPQAPRSQQEPKPPPRRQADPPRHVNSCPPDNPWRALRGHSPGLAKLRPPTPSAARRHLGAGHIGHSRSVIRLCRETTRQQTCPTTRLTLPVHRDNVNRLPQCTIESCACTDCEKCAKELFKIDDRENR